MPRPSTFAEILYRGRLVRRPNDWKAVFRAGAPSYPGVPNESTSSSPIRKTKALVPRRGTNAAYLGVEAPRAETELARPR